MNYPSNCGTPTADLLTVKLPLNSVLLTAGAEFMTIEFKKFYLNTPLKWYEYFRLKLANLPENFIDEYQLQDKATKDGLIYVEIHRGMYRMLHSGLIVQALLENNSRSMAISRAS